jgi:hypothetical protein
MPVKLVSLVNRPLTFNLVCKAERVRRDTFEYDPTTGHRHRMRGYVRMPASLDLAAKGRTKLLPDAVANETEVENARKRGDIRVINVSTDEAEREAADEQRRAKRAQQRSAPPPSRAKTSAPKPKTEAETTRRMETAKKED